VDIRVTIIDGNGEDLMEYNELSELEKKAYELIKKAGKKGIYQNDLWRQLNINSRDASRVVSKLLKKKLIIRKPAVNRGRRTYLLLLAPQKRKKKPKKQKIVFLTRIDIRPFLDIPCVRCPFIDKCYPRGFYDPTNCSWIEEWIEGEKRKLGSSK